MNMFHEPTKDHLAKLSAPWCCSYSGGKDSTSLVTWIEWLRRTGQINIERPQLVQSDTQVEDSSLEHVSSEMRRILTSVGWVCAVVTPMIHQKLYNRIIGIGNTPIHPGIRSMRWCTRSTKIDPMDRWREKASDPSGMILTGLRFGESTIRDGKLKRKGCSAGGECGIPDPGERTYSPLLHWTTCNVIDWLNGAVDPEVNKVMRDLLDVTRKLVDIYNPRTGQSTFEWADPDIKVSRFGCIGCPDLVEGSEPSKTVVARNGKGHPLNEIYAVWHFARKFENRLWKNKDEGRRRYRLPGPIKLSIRPLLFERIMEIQRRAGIVLVTPEDEAFIRDCWERKVYPRGWSEADELTTAPDNEPLFRIVS